MSLHSKKDINLNMGIKQDTPHDVRCVLFVQIQPAGAGGRTRTGTVSPPVDFESTTSANSITSA